MNGILKVKQAYNDMYQGYITMHEMLQILYEEYHPPLCYSDDEIKAYLKANFLHGHIESFDDFIRSIL